MPAHDIDWKFWGQLHDQKATSDVIRTLQAKGLKVRVVRVGNRNDIYTDRTIEPDTAA